MPIADQTLQPWLGIRRPQPLRWMVITEREILHAWKRKGVRILCYLCWGIFMIFGAIFYISSNYDQLSAIFPDKELVAEFLVIDANDYHTLITFWHRFPISLCLFLAVAVGAGAITEDLKSQGLPLYLSRALSPWDYVLGKGMGVALYVAAVTVAPVTLLYGLDAFFREDWGLLWRHANILAAVWLYGFILIVSLTLLVLMFSSLQKNSRFSVMTALGYYYLSFGMAEILENNLVAYDTRDQQLHTIGVWGWMSIYEVWECIAARLFGLPHPDWVDIGFGTAVAAWVVCVGICLLVLRRRIRGMEVFS